jgi:hypothetical protein
MEYVDTDLQPISDELKSDFMSLRIFLSEQERSGHILLLYRGEEQQNIRRRLTNGGLGIETPEVFQRAFYFGDKARHFSVDVLDGNRNFLTGINDCSDETLYFIYECICNVLKEPKIYPRIMKNTSREFRLFFLNNNLHEFLHRLNEPFTHEEKLKCRDYYLYFLHVAGAAGIRKETMFVSTSTDKMVALRFFKTRKKIRNNISLFYSPSFFFSCHSPMDSRSSSTNS